MKELFFETLDSTNTYLKKHYEQVDDFCFVRTDHQSDGKGRNGRKWLDSKGENLMFSLLIKNKKLIDKYMQLSMNSAYLVLKALEDLGLKDLSIKWPNDVYARGKKISGILLEAVSKKEMECLIIGIGINVNQKEFNDNYLIEPTSICKELGKKIDLIKFKDKIYDSLLNNLGKDYLNQIKEYDYLRGKRVTAEINGESKIITVIGINEDYSLNISIDGKETNIFSGEISFHLEGGI